MAVVVHLSEKVDDLVVDVLVVMLKNDRVTDQHTHFVVVMIYKQRANFVGAPKRSHTEHLMAGGECGH